jgi:hypothetical protein
MQLKQRLKRILTEQQAGMEERNIKSQDVMPLVDSIDVTDGDGGGDGGANPRKRF